MTGPLHWVPLLGLLPLAVAGAVPGFDGGHVKLRWLGSTYPDDSAYREVFGEAADDEYADLRLKFSGQRDRLSVQADYQVIGQWGDSLEFPRDANGLLLLPKCSEPITSQVFTTKQPVQLTRLVDEVHLQDARGARGNQALRLEREVPPLPSLPSSAFQEQGLEGVPAFLTFPP